MLNEPVTIFHLDIPLRNPFLNAGGTVDSRSVALVRMGSGPYGWGEAAPYPRQDESIEDVLRAARAGARTPTLEAALDEAAADLRARQAGESLAQIAGATVSTVPVSIAVGLVDPLVEVERAIDRGVSRFKLKIEPGRVDHVADIRRRYREIVMGVDANGSFDPSTAHELTPLAGLDIAYLEQPAADLGATEASSMKWPTDVPVFADESVRSVTDAEVVLGLGHVDGVVVKPGRIGWSGVLVVAAMANASGKLWRASGLLETGIGRAYTDILAARPDAFLSDVAPAEWFLEQDIARSRNVEGSIATPSGAGLGVEPNQDVLDQRCIVRIDLT
jgi:L-alanine-DL-glutamate epimerase-like enolase superfamily enzyme